MLCIMPKVNKEIQNIVTLFDSLLDQLEFYTVEKKPVPTMLLLKLQAVRDAIGYTSPNQ